MHYNVSSATDNLGSWIKKIVVGFNNIARQIKNCLYIKCPMLLKK